jgi:uncharacterized protein YcfJ
MHKWPLMPPRLKEANMKPNLISVRTAVMLAVAALPLGQAAWAGPRVGDVVGTPTSAAMTVQARVVSATPVIAQVAVPGQICRDEQQQTQAKSSGAGAVMGAIAGGAMGNAVGKGAGNVLATGAGIIGGAILGDQIESNGKQPTTQTVRRCTQQTSYENRVVAYNVIYEYAGQQYSTQAGQEPGPTIPLQITLTPLISGPVTSTTVIESTTLAPPPPAATVRVVPEVFLGGGGGWGGGWRGGPRGW